MIDSRNIFLFSDQPTTCPKCGSRTDAFSDFAHTNSKREIHECTRSCGFMFIIEEDDFEDEFEDELINEEDE